MPRATPELWTILLWARDAKPQALIDLALRYEAEGWNGVVCPDTQNIVPDVYVCLTAIAMRTSRLMLATGVTNPVTRHPAVTASAIAALQAVSNGRAVLAIGRGDSALAYLGASPVRLKAFEQYVDIVQRYLRGESLPLAEVVPQTRGSVAGFENLAIGHVPEGSQLLWLRSDVPKVPVEVTATGPKAIAMGGRLAERVQLTLGTKPQRVAWGIETARTAAAGAGRDPAALSLGAYVCVVPCRQQKARMLELVSPMVATGARFAVMEKKLTVPASPREQQVFANLVDTYDMSQHGRSGQQVSALDAEFVDSYAIVGPPSECVERLQKLVALGLERFVVTHIPIELPEYEEVHQTFVEEVMPALR